jgi:hypothetical protein
VEGKGRNQVYRDLWNLFQAGVEVALLKGLTERLEMICIQRRVLQAKGMMLAGSLGLGAEEKRMHSFSPFLPPRALALMQGTTMNMQTDWQVTVGGCVGKRPELREETE